MVQTYNFDIHLILIGDELLSGKTIDVNGPWLGKYLNSQCHNIKSIKVISDQAEMIQSSVDEHWSKKDHKNLVILSGGLGPTRDDKTKQALATYFDSKLVENDQLAEHLKKVYEQRGKKWQPNINNYHLFPEKFEPYPNKIGLAPGLKFKDQDKGHYLISAPGVPLEFQSMIENFFHEHPELTKQQDQKSQVFKILPIRTRYIPEEEIFGKLCPNLWDELEKYGSVSSLPEPLGVNIYVKLQANSKNKLTQYENEIKLRLKESALAPYIWHIGQEDLCEKIILEAQEKGIQLGFAESCTGGLTASSITDIPGSSKVFQGSIVSYSNQVKEEILNVEPSVIKKYGAVSQEVASQMALGARKSLNADICISFSGIAGPGGGSKNKPVGTVAIGVSSQGEKVPGSSLFYFQGDRQRLKRRFTLQGLHLLLDAIRNY